MTSNIHSVRFIASVEGPVVGGARKGAVVINTLFIKIDF